jgi:hypothetical protein
MTTQPAVRAAYTALLEALRAAQQVRNERDELTTDTNGEPIAAWALHERDVMLRETNRWRDYARLPHVDMAAIERVERMAAGHSDYTTKFAWYCAEVSMGWRPDREPPDVHGVRSGRRGVRLPQLPRLAADVAG